MLILKRVLNADEHTEIRGVLATAKFASGAQTAGLARTPDAPEILALTAVYNGLLREWIEV